MSRCSHKFWTNNASELFCSDRIIPMKNMSLEDQLNSLTRLLIIICVIVYLVGYKNVVPIFFVLLGIIIILYYIQMYRTRENFINTTQSQSPFSNGSGVVTSSGINLPESQSTFQSLANRQRGIDSFMKSDYRDISNPPSKKYIFARDARAVRNNQTYNSPNQALAGNRQNPNTYIAPVIIAPIAASDYWRNNGLTKNWSQLNESTTQQLYSSGYVLDNCCPDYQESSDPPLEVGCKSNPTHRTKNTYLDGSLRESEIRHAPTSFEVPYFNTASPAFIDRDPVQLKKKTGNNGSYEGYSEGFGGRYQTNNSIRENFANNFTDIEELTKRGDVVPMKDAVDNNLLDPPHLFPFYESVDRIHDNRPKMSGDIDTHCGYDQSNLKSYIPSNLPVGNCQKEAIFKDYNKNLFTETIQPGLYMRSEITEPTSSNLGISFTQQFEPQTLEKDGNGEVYINHDPRMYEGVPLPKENPYLMTPKNEDIYDPRLTGYGTNYRSYVDKMTGQPRFYYSDTDSIRRPNYITRNNVDFLQKAESYGPMKPQEELMKDSADIRATVEKAFLDNSISFRDDLQSRLMRKINAQAWQKRLAPLDRGQSTHMSSKIR